MSNIFLQSPCERHTQTLFVFLACYITRFESKIEQMVSLKPYQFRWVRRHWQNLSRRNFTDWSNILFSVGHVHPSGCGGAGAGGRMHGVKFRVKVRASFLLAYSGTRSESNEQAGFHFFFFFFFLNSLQGWASRMWRSFGKLSLEILGNLRKFGVQLKRVVQQKSGKIVGKMRDLLRKFGKQRRKFGVKQGKLQQNQGEIKQICGKIWIKLKKCVAKLWRNGKNQWQNYAKIREICRKIREICSKIMVQLRKFMAKFGKFRAWNLYECPKRVTHHVQALLSVSHYISLATHASLGSNPTKSHQSCTGGTRLKKLLEIIGFRFSLNRSLLNYWS